MATNLRIAIMTKEKRLKAQNNPSPPEIEESDDEELPDWGISDDEEEDSVPIKLDGINIEMKDAGSEDLSLKLNKFKNTDFGDNEKEETKKDSVGQQVDLSKFAEESDDEELDWGISDDDEQETRPKFSLNDDKKDEEEEDEEIEDWGISDDDQEEQSEMNALQNIFKKQEEVVIISIFV